MEAVFPDETGYAGFFMVGFRKDLTQPTRTQRVGTAIMKRTYTIGADPGTGPRGLIPASEALPVYTQDTPDNWLVNSDFELSETFEADGANTKPGGWTAENAATAIRVAGGVDGMALRISGANVAGRVIQDVDVRTAVKNRRFRFSFSARTDAVPAKVTGAHLEADGHILCSIAANLNTTLTRFSATGTWPAGLEATAIKVVLPIAFNPDHPTNTRVVYYDQVQLEERANLSEWNDSAWLKIEHDLASYKQEGDIIILDYPATQGKVYVNGNTWLNGNALSGQQKALFGWEPRVGTARETEAGTFSDNPDHYPPEWPVMNPLKDPLPSDFDNQFYNGYRRNARVAHSEPYLLPLDVIEIERNGIIGYAFRLGDETASAQVRYYRGYGPDDERYWRTQNVPMHADTLVVEPEKNRCYVVWRGAWDFDAHPEDAYRQLEVSAL